MMERFRTVDTVRTGIVGTFLVVIAAVAAMNAAALPIVSAGTSYSGLFLDTGGLETGAAVEVAGVRVGTVTDIAVAGQAVLVTFSVEGKVLPGIDTRLAIATETVLGTKNLRMDPRGDGRLSTTEPVGLDRTTSPYQLTDALGDLTDDAAGIDTEQLTDSLAATTEMLDRTPDDLGRAIDGVGRLSATVASRDESLRDLLASAEKVTGVLADRSAQVDTLIVDAATVLAELDRRRGAVDTLFGTVTRLADQLRGLVADNEAELAPTLASLDSVLTVLTDNKADISAAIENLGPYVTQLGEAVSSGPFFNSYIQNLIPGQVISPFIRAALGLGPAPADSTSVNPLTALNGAPR
ncbi:MCE family protein [Rhodococcus sp. MEB041]|uniref:MCE family protein n=1 Tax=Rhodococcus sp. MEB041 TaxID=3040323 RepID=UPI0025507CBF|nr:MCE family protein [Rhodococcus sp. MEB041]